MPTTQASTATSTKNLTMDELLAQSELKQLEAGDVVEGTITSVKKHEMWIDLGAGV